MVERFAFRARERPDGVALVSGAAHLSYRGLARRARALGRRLAALGVGPDAAVGLMVERSPELVLAILGVLEAGGYYVPLDPDYPAERQELILADTGARVILADERLAPAVPASYAGQVLSLGALLAGAGDSEAAEPEAGLGARRPGPESLAYVMFTSGSTGRPKGVGIPDRGILRLVERGPGGSRAPASGDADLGAEETLLQLAPAAFDASTFEIWAALLHGAALVVAPPGSQSLADLAQIVARHRVSTLFVTVGLFHQLVEAELDGLAGVRQLLTGGDVVSPQHARRVLEELPATVTFNVYGPTENTSFTSGHRMERPADAGPPGEPLPIGRPIVDTRVYVLDPDLRPVAPGAPGELCTGGEGLARGYLGRPALTARSFVPDPVSGEPGARLYRTGDRARLRADGTIGFLGRLDAQVKLRGFRVEPGEIEAVLGEHPAVASAAVVPRGDRLVGYLVAAGEPAPVGEIAASLAARLPAFMVPSGFVWLDELPLNRNGKVDRKRLAAEGPEPDWAGDAADRYEPPRTPSEELVAAAFATILGVARVGRRDDFFDLGGHSLLATRLVSRLRADLGIELPLRRVFEQPTVAAVAAAIEGERADPAAAPLTPIPAAERAGPAAGPLETSFSQERLWFLDRLEPGSPAYNIPLALRLEGDLGPAALAAALAAVVARHEALRTTFGEGEDGAPVQRIGPPPPVRLPVVDLSGLPAGARSRRCAALAAAEAARPFDLATGPLLRIFLVRSAPAEHSLVVNLHHVVADGWSLGILVRELAAFYPARAAPERPPCRSCRSSTPTSRAGSGAGRPAAPSTGSSSTGAPSSRTSRRSSSPPTGRPPRCGAVRPCAWPSGSPSR